MNPNNSLSVQNIDELSRLSQMMAKSGLFKDTRDAAQCGVKILAGLEMGFSAVASMSGIYIINGKPTVSANLMAAAIKKSGKYNYRVREHSRTCCKIEFFENGESIGISEFTDEDAKDAGLLNGPNSGNWKKYAKNMMFARAMSNGVRFYCPDIFLGIAAYTPEEIGAKVDSEGDVIDVSCNNDPTPQQIQPSKDNNTVIREIRTILGIGREETAALVHSFDAKEPNHMTEKSMIALISLLCEDWASSTNAFKHANHFHNSFTKHISSKNAPIHELPGLVADWVEHCLSKSESSE